MATVASQTGVEPPAGGRRSQASALVDLAGDVELFHTPAGEPFATVPVGTHHETHPVRSSALRSWLRRRHWAVELAVVKGSVLTDAIETLAARAEFDGETYPVAIRVAEQAGSVYLDLANDAWEAVEISTAGWRVIADPPVRFRRSASMTALPLPVQGGSLAQLRTFVNVADDDGWHLFVGLLVAAFRPSGPYLIGIHHGEQGSAKSTTCRVFRSLVDPSSSPLRSEPRDIQDLLIAARNNWVVTFDNVSHLPPWLSDAMCRLSTGGGLGKRQLYTDQDEVILDAQRPLILNGISELATRGDLLDRALILEQPTIEEHGRRSEAEFWRAFAVVRPQILGALLDAVAGALAHLPTVSVNRLPRMADPTQWVTAAEPALGQRPGTFAEAYARNRHEGHALALEASLLVDPLMALAEDGDWQGTSSELLERLAAFAGEMVTRQRGWPQTPRGLTEALKRQAPSLRSAGLEWERLERTGTTRPHRVHRTGATTVTSVTSVSADARVDDGHDGDDGCAAGPDVVSLDWPGRLDRPPAGEEQGTWTA